MGTIHWSVVKENFDIVLLGEEPLLNECSNLSEVNLTVIRTWGDRAEYAEYTCSVRFYIPLGFKKSASRSKAKSNFFKDEKFYTLLLWKYDDYGVLIYLKRA